VPERVTVVARSAKVSVRAADVDQVSAQGATVTHGPSGVVVGGGSGSVTVVVPVGTDVVVGTASGKVICEGRLGAVTITARSGHIIVEEAASVDARTASARIDIGRVAGECNTLTKSGVIRIERAGSADVSAISGKVTIGEVGHARVKCVAGAVKLTTGARPDVKVRTISGAVQIVVPRGSTPQTNLRAKVGRIRCDCEVGDDGVVDVETVSGRISVVCSS
jgi:DUF4097 and DUF4098 domain-containing protein YvlB